MSEPTGDGKQQPDPDQVQDQVSGSDFGDPTAPVWVDPTAAVPAAPMPPGQAYPYGQQPAAAPQAVPPPPPQGTTPGPSSPRHTTSSPLNTASRPRRRLTANSPLDTASSTTQLVHPRFRVIRLRSS